MDEEERRSKVQAGKEALLAFQRKKKVKRRKRKTDTSDSSSRSEPLSSSLGALDVDSSGATLPHSGNVSPIPFDDTGHTSLPAITDGRPPAATSITQLLSGHTSHTEHPLEERAVQPYGTTAGSGNLFIDSGLSIVESRPRVEQSDVPDGSAHRHVSPVQPDTTNTADLEQQLKASQLLQQQLQHELNSLRENQFDAIEGAKKEVVVNYESQFTVLQQTLLQTEQRCIALEAQLSEITASHRAEIEKVLGQQEEIRETMLQQRDQKHAAHVMRLTAELTSQSEISGVVMRDSDEQEAERLQMIKEKMKEMHDEEKRQIAAKHEQEKVKVQEEYQQQMDLYRQQMEQLANTKIQEMHAQFMSAHQIVSEQKNMAEAAVAQWRGRVEEIQQQLDAVNEERSSVDVKYQSMIQTHSAEVELLNQKSHDLQQRLVEWKEKAASLEARLEKLDSQRADDVDNMQQQNQEAVQRIIADYEEKLKAQHSLIEEYQTRVQSLEATHHVAINEIEQQHVQDMETLKTKHSSEVSLLEESISGSSGDRASLEVAEEHMKSLQVQLDAYRTQESSFQGRLESLEQQHIVDTELLKQQLEAQKVEEVEQVSAKFAAQIESLEEELTTLQGLVEAGQSQTTDKEVIEAMKAKHQREILELQTTLQNNHELALKGLRKELELAHSTAVESLQQQHANMVSILRKELDTEWAGKVRKAEHAKRAELEQLTSEHKQSLNRLQQSLAQTEESVIAKAEARVTGLEAELQKFRGEQSEWLRSRQDLLSQLEFSQRQLQESSQHFSRINSEKVQLEEQCQKYRNEMKSLEMDLSIAHGSSEQDKQALAEAREEIGQCRAKAEELQGEIGRLEEEQRASVEQVTTVLELTDQLAQKNVAIADLEAQNDSLNTEVFSLTQKCHQHIATTEMLQKQLESTGSADEQITSLQQQLSDLLPVKEGYSRMQERVESLESQLQSREKELGTLQFQLEQAAQQVTETGAQWSAKFEELTASSANETEALRQEIATHRAREVELKQQLCQCRQQINTLEPKEQENAQAIVGLNQTIQDLRGRLDSAGNEIKQLRQEKRKLEQDLKDSQGILDELAGDNHESELSKNYERLQQDFETVRAEKTQLALELAELQKEQKQVFQEQKKSWEGKLQEQEKVIHDLQAQLSARESAFTEIQNEFGRQLTEAEKRESSLLQRLQDSTMTQEQLGTVLGEKSALEEILLRARQNLKEKLQEKETLEKELNFHRTELERRLAEKHRLEELLFEKSRFEQEVQSQRDQLQEELKAIESKLKLKDVELEQERSEWLEQVQEKDLLLQVKEAEVQQKGDEYRQKEEQLQQQHSTELSQLSEGLNHQHNMHISTLTEEHRQQLTDVETSLRYKHSEAMHTLEAKHKKELEEVREQLLVLHEEQLEKLRGDLDERRKREVSTVKEVLEREKQADMAELETSLRAGEEAKLQELELNLKQHYQKKYEEELAAEREHLEQTHKMHIDSLMAGISEDSQQQFQLQLEHIQEAHKQEIQTLKLHYEATLSKGTAAAEQVAQLEAEKQIQRAREAFEEELRGKLVQREEEISSAFEQRVTQVNTEWEERMAASLEACQLELVSKHQSDIEKLKSQHTEETQNALKACQNAFEEQIEALRTEHDHERAKGVVECEEMLRKQYAEQMEVIVNIHERKHKAEVGQLRTQLEHLQEAQHGFQTREQQCSERLISVEAQVKELEDVNQKLQVEHREQIERLAAEKEANLVELVQRHENELEELNASQQACESALKSEYESQVTLLKEQCESLVERQRQGSSSAQADLQEQWEKEKLAREREFREEIAELQTKWEQKLHEAQLEHMHQINALTEESQSKQSELELQHERRYQALVQAHEDEKLEMFEKHERDVQDLNLAQSKRLLALKAEVQEASDAANESLTKQLETELQNQREILEKQHEGKLRLQESKLQGEFSLELDKMKAELDEKYMEMLAEVHTEAALKSATRLEELALKLGADKEKALTEQRAMLEATHRQRSSDIAREHQQVLEVQRQELQSQYRDKLGELESTMAAERKKQIVLLKEQYDQEWMEREQALRSQLEEEHVRQMEELIAQCAQEKAVVQEGLQKDLAEQTQRLESELTVLRERSEEDVKAAETRAGEEVRKHLVNEYMTKFKDMTEKLQQVHQSELDARQQEKLLGETRHVEELDRLREEVEARHQHDLSQVVQSHKQELTGLQELYEARLQQTESEHAVRVSELQQQFETLQHSEQQGIEATVRLELSQLNHKLESNLSQLEQERSEFRQREAALEQQAREAVEMGERWRGEVTSLQQQCADLRRSLQTSEGELAQLTQQHKQLQDSLATSERRLAEAEECHTAQLHQVEEGLMQRIRQAEGDLQAAVAESESYRKTQEELKAERAKAFSSLKQQMDHNEQLSEENAHLRERLSHVKGHLDTVHTQADREHQEDSNTLTMLHDKMRALRAERDVLQSTVAALQSAVVSSLQLAPIINSVLTGQQLQAGGVASGGEMGVGNGLPERLLAPAQLQGEELPPPGTTSEEEGDSSSVSEVREPTSTHSNYSPPMLPMSFSADWTMLKQTPSEDSGLASQLTSVVRSESTLVDTALYPSTSQAAITPPTPTPDPTSHTSPLTPAQSEQDLSSPSVTPMVDASHLHPGAPSILSVSLMSATDTTLHLHPQQLEQSSYLEGDPTSHNLPPDLSIVPLDSTLFNTSQMVIPGEPSSSTVDLTTLQDGLSKFHDTVCALVRSYITVAAQASESQHELQCAREQLAHLSSQLAQLGQSQDELRALMARREEEGRQKEGEVAETREQLVAAEAKIQSLVEQLEGDRLESELIEEMQNLVEKFKMKETSEAELRQQLMKMEGHLQGLQLENEGLSSQLGQLSRASEDQRKELQERSATLERELEGVQRNCASARQECEALRETNRDLRTQQEKLEMALRTKQEEANQMKVEFTQRLESKQGEIRELEDMRNQLAAKEEIEENLMLERDSLAAKLSTAEHQLATYQLLPSAEEQDSRIQQMAERENELSGELQEQVRLCESLRARLEGTQATLNEASQESARVNTAQVQLQAEVRTLQDELQRKEVSLQNALVEKLSHERTLQSTREELAVLREQSDDMSAQKEKAEAQLHEVEGKRVDAEEKGAEVERLAKEKSLLTQQVSLLQSELHGHRQSSLSQQQECESLQAQLAEKEREEEEASVVRTQLENRVAGLTEQLREREEDTHMQVETLEQELTTVRAELTQRCAEVELVKSEGKREQRQLQHMTTQLEQEKSVLLQRLQQSATTLDQLRATHSQEVTALRGKVEEEKRRVEECEATLHRLNTEHSQKLSDVHISHLESLHHQREQLEAQHAGELSYLWLHHRQQLDHLRADHGREVRRIVGEHRQLLSTLGTGLLGDVWVDEDDSESLLIKIAELAPLLASEAGEVRDLCNMTGQFLPGSPLPPSTTAASTTLTSHKDSLQAVVTSLKQLLEEIRTIKGDGSGVEDWRGELLQAVEKILDHEHSLLASTMEGGKEEQVDGVEDRYRELLQQQLSEHSALLRQLHSADRMSLLGEIRQLHGTLEDDRREQKQQSQELISQLEAELGASQDQLHELEQEKAELDSVNHSLRCTIEGLQAELEETHGSLSDLEESMQKATTTITSLQQELQASCAREADLRRTLSEEEASSQLHLEQLRREHSSTVTAERRLSSEVQATLQRERAMGTELRETLAQKVAQSQQMSAEITDLRKRLQSTEDRLRESEHHSQILQESIEKIQEEAARANTVVEQSEQVLREKQFEIERLGAGLRSREVDGKAQVDHVGGLLESEKRTTAALKGAVQAKEAELTRTMDQFLQEKVATARAHGELNAMRGRLNRAQTELEALQKQMTDLRTGGGERVRDGRVGEQEVATLRRQCRQIEASHQAARLQLEEALRHAEDDQHRLAREREEEGRRHEELQQLLHQQLSKSTLLKSALDREVSDGMDLRQMVEQLLKQERLQAVAQESLQMERDRLEREVRRLHRDVQEWKELAQARAVGSPGKGLPSSASSSFVQQQQSATIASLQVERTELRRTLSQLQGQISDLEEGRAQDKELLDAQAELHQELESKQEEVGQLQEHVAQLQEQLARAQKRMATDSRAEPALSVEVQGATPQDAMEAKLTRLYAQYRQAEIHRKALVFQKHYLQCQVDAFYQTQQAALMMMADMGAPVDSGPKTPFSKFPRPYARFRAVGCVVVATLRFQYMRRKKLQYLKSKVTKLQQSSGKVADIPPASSRGDNLTKLQSQSQHSAIGMSHGIQTVLSGPPPQSRVRSSFPYPQHAITSGSHLSARNTHSVALSSATSFPSISQTSSKPRSASTTSSQQHSKALSKGHISNSTSSKQHGSKGTQSLVSKAPPLQLPSHSSSSTITRFRGHGDDPQLVAYIEGLERLQARLSKTKL